MADSMDDLICSLIEGPQYKLSYRIDFNNLVHQIQTKMLPNNYWSFIRKAIEQSTYSSENIKLNDAAGTSISIWLKKNKRLNIVKWVPNNNNYPKFMLLGPDKGILAYVEFFYHSTFVTDKDIPVECFGLCHLMTDIRKRLPLVDSDLDRPVFYVHIMDYFNLKGIFFETTEMIKNNIFENSNFICNLGSEEVYFSNINEMGDFKELICVFEDLKKNNVKFY